MRITHAPDANVPEHRTGIASSDVVRERFGDADGLRAIAILAVVGFETVHVAAPEPLLIHPALARLAADASQGLTLFFVLSGFTLAYPALAAMRQDGRSFLDIGRYAIKRLLRIYPLFLALIGLTLVLPALASRYGLPAFAGVAGPATTDTFVRNALFAGDGLGNDGFRALAIVARWYLVFPLLLLLWVRAPWIFAGVAALATVLDLTTAAHGWYLGALLPFMLGIVAADLRSQHHRFERFALLLALGAALIALLVEPFLGLLPGPVAAPGVLRVDPFWSIALFGLVAGAGTFRIPERILSATVLRLVGAASFAISLVVVPVASFVVRQSSSAFGPLASAANAAALAVLIGYIFWQALDRWFADGPLRREVADVLGPWVDRVLAVVRADRVVIGSPPAPPEPEIPDERLAEGFYAPPPRALPADLAVVSKKSGTAEELAAEILETKKRLSERTALLFSEPRADPGYEKPGFYPRKSNGAATPGRTPLDMRRQPRRNTDFEPIDFTRLPTVATAAPPPADAAPAPTAPPPPAIPEPEPEPIQEYLDEPEAESAPLLTAVPDLTPTRVRPEPELEPEPEPNAAPAPEPQPEAQPTVLVVAPPEPLKAPPAVPRKPIRLRIGPPPGGSSPPPKDSRT